MKKLLRILVMAAFFLGSAGLIYTDSITWIKESALRPTATLIHGEGIEKILHRKNTSRLHSGIKKSIVLIRLYETMNEEVYVVDGVGFIIGESDNEFLLLSAAHIISELALKTKPRKDIPFRSRGNI
ncbi:MAG: hypothetical protein U9Q24_01250 [Candidatus Ratteibacteria bacterium]|nr:hypothetical protein [Candidatus Ratteibacteria bacterium]